MQMVTAAAIVFLLVACAIGWRLYDLLRDKRRRSRRRRQWHHGAAHRLAWSLFMVKPRQRRLGHTPPDAE